MRCFDQRRALYFAMSVDHSHLSPCQVNAFLMQPPHCLSHFPYERQIIWHLLNRDVPLTEAKSNTNSLAHNACTCII